MADRLWQWLRARDPTFAALRSAVRAAVVVPVNFAIGSQLIGNAQVATFAAFGSFALLLFANFPGGRATRASAYLLLGLAGVVLISLGTAVATPDWLAVLAMAVVGFCVLFSGVISSMINGATSAALLTFILAVLLPGLRSDLPQRLAGWGLAVAVAVPVALFVWPPDDQNVLRRRTATLCRALASMLHLQQPPPGGVDPFVAVGRARRDLRTAFRASAARPTAVSTGARLTIRLVDELEWLTTAVMNACSDAPDGWPPAGRRLRDAASRVMSACAETLDHDGDSPSTSAGADLDSCLADLVRARSDVAASTLAQLRTNALVPAAGASAANPGEFERPLYAAHELGYTVGLAGRTVSAIARADGRSWWARATGRGIDLSEFGLLNAAQRLAVGHLDRHSVWLQSSIRGAIGLALAVLLSRVVGAQNAFWVGLGALSVLRSNALATGATVLRALLGTVLGFAIGAGVIAVLGTNPAVLWTVFPLVVLIAAFAPAVISFVAGQAAFTVFSIILFNIIAPIGWQVGVLRIEDVALGCAASLVAGLLLWPRGAAAALGVAFAEAYGAAARYLQAAMDELTGEQAVDARGSAQIATSARGAGIRLDDALRQYLAERGPKHVALESVAALSNGATRLRLAGMAVARLREAAPEGQVMGPDDDRLHDAAAVLDRRARRVTQWYSALATAFDSEPARSAPVAYGRPDESFLEVVLPAVDGCGDPQRAERAERLLWSGQYLGDVDRLRAELIGPAAQVAAARAQDWWRR